MFKYLQRTGKALMLPIAALPIAGILLGIGGAFLGIAGMTDAPAIYQSIADVINNSQVITALLTIMKNKNIIIGKSHNKKIFTYKLILKQLSIYV